jgi:type IV secretory pathway VirD2 relaxase
MASRDDDRFRVKPAAPRSRGGPRSQRFISQVLKEVSKTGAKRSRTQEGRPESTFGRGRVAAATAGQRLGPNARRVVIKSRFVVLKRAGVNSVAVHLRYIERDGVTRDGQKGQAYGADTDQADLKAFQERGRGDRHQFRFIVAPEDGLELEDLRGFTRQLMRRMELDLETRLDWVAVDHWDTDNPHTHIVLSGRTASGEDLVISPDYMAHGMRMRASEIATEWLGPRTDLEIRHSLMREVDQQRLTGLDRALMRQAGREGSIDLTGSSSDRQRQNALRARLQRLEGMRLAERVSAHRWRLQPGMAVALGAMGEREDALDSMRRALGGKQRELVVHGTKEASAVPVIGRIVGKGLTDELSERGYLVVDGIDGHAHYLKLPPSADLAKLPMYGIVEAKQQRPGREVDRAIVAVTENGIYRVADHLSQLRRAGDGDPQTAVAVHVRRLEALRRAGIVERTADGIWNIPANLMQSAEQHDARKTNGWVIELRSHLSIEQQVRAVGATWLDRSLVTDAGVANRGFGAEVRDAMGSRADFLSEQGLAERRGQRVVLARNLLTTLRDRDLAAAGQSLQEQTGQTYRPLRDDQQVSGIYRQSIQLASGRFAVLDDGMGFSLVPWRPVIERRLGQQVSAVARGSSVTWHLGRQRGPAL